MPTLRIAITMPAVPELQIFVVLNVFRVFVVFGGFVVFLVFRVFVVFGGSGVNVDFVSQCSEDNVDPMWTRCGLGVDSVSLYSVPNVDPCGPNVDSMWTRCGLCFPIQRAQCGLVPRLAF